MKDKSFIITNTKNGLPHTLPMNTFIYNLFENLKIIDPMSMYSLELCRE